MKLCSACQGTGRACPNGEDYAECSHPPHQMDDCPNRCIATEVWECRSPYREQWSCSPPPDSDKDRTHQGCGYITRCGYVTRYLDPASHVLWCVAHGSARGSETHCNVGILNDYTQVRDVPCDFFVAHITVVGKGE